MSDTTRNRAITERYKTLVPTNYKEPGQDGQFDYCAKMYWWNCAEINTQMPKKNFEANLDSD